MTLALKYKIELVEKDGKHFYLFDDNPTYFPGVTTILSVLSKPYLMPWVAKVCGLHTKGILEKVATKYTLSPRFIETLYNRSKIQHRLIKEKAADMGTRAHAIFDQMVVARAGLGENIAVDADIRVAVDGFIYWVNRERLKIAYGDTKIGDPEIGYGGSIDAIATDDNGRYVILDYKTSNQIDKISYPLQVAAYAHGLKVNLGLNYYPECFILRFGKEKPEIEKVKVTDTTMAFNIFKDLVSVYRGLQLPLLSEREVFKHKKTKKEKTK